MTGVQTCALPIYEEMDNNVSRIKNDRPIGSKDVAPRKKMRRNQESILLDSKQISFKEKTTP